MTSEIPYERLLQKSLQGELKIVNSQLPVQPKPLADLLDEEYPQVVCRDGTTHLFRRKELDYLAGLLDDYARKELRLPIMIEVSSGAGEIAVLGTDVTAALISCLLGMPLQSKGGRVVIHKPQLALLRQKLRTTTQYVFRPPTEALQ